MKFATRSAAALLAFVLLVGPAAAQNPNCPAPTQQGLCSSKDALELSRSTKPLLSSDKSLIDAAGGVSTIALRAAALGVQAAVVCTIFPGANVLTPALPLTTSSNGAIVTSGVIPIIAVQPVPFVGTFTVTYPAEPSLDCPGKCLTARLQTCSNIQLQANACDPQQRSRLALLIVISPAPYAPLQM